MAKRGKISVPTPENLPHMSINEALSCINQKVRVSGVVLDMSPGKRTSGTDYHCSIKILDGVDAFSCDLLVNFFGETMDKLPQIETKGDIITLSCIQIKTYNKKINAVFRKGNSTFALYEGKYGQGSAPYHCSPNYHTLEEDKQVVVNLRNLFEDVLPYSVSNKATLREIQKGEFDLVCKVLHMSEVNQDELMLFVWNGTDAPPCIIEEKLDHEKECPLPLQLEGERLPKETLSKFRTVGTVLRVKVDRRKGKLDFSSSIVGRWVYLIRIAVEVHAGLWHGILAPCTRMRYVPDEDSLIINCERDFKKRYCSAWDRVPFTSFGPPSATEVVKDAPIVTLMDIMNYSETIAKFKCTVRVVAMLPSNPNDFRCPKRIYRIRLTLEDPTARIHAFLFNEDAEEFFDGYPDIDELTRKRNKLLGICSEGAEDAPRQPPWMDCCIKSYHLDEERQWETRRYRVFGTVLK